MRFKQVRARDFRNFAMLEAAFPGEAEFICGENGQGKTNLLEALGLVTSLRSFRTTDIPALIRWEAKPREAVLVYDIEHRQFGETRLEIHLRPGSKQVLLDGNPVRRMGDMLGLFPTITFSSQDIQILRGSPSLRRRTMDLMFVAMDPGYYGLLGRYHKALLSRNRLLKERAADRVRAPFEEILLRSGWELTRMRGQLLEAFEPHFREAYAGISPVDENPVLKHVRSLAADTEADYARSFRSRLARDRELGTTQAGPHRDDLAIELQGHASREFASEGQQRGLVLALRMGLLHWYRQSGGTPPVILADDIVGELDARRRAGFWQMVDHESQVIATGTRFPEEAAGHKWTNWIMRAGCISRVERNDGA